MGCEMAYIMVHARNQLLCLICYNLIVSRIMFQNGLYMARCPSDVLISAPFCSFVPLVYSSVQGYLMLWSNIILTVTDDIITTCPGCLLLIVIENPIIRSYLH